MKRLLAIVFAVSLAGSAAASVGFDFGTNFYRPEGASDVTNGQNFRVSWQLENDLALGVYTESSAVLSVTAVQVLKGVIKGAAVGLNLGSGTDAAAVTETLVDVFGEVTILSGAGEKVKGALKAVAAARFIEGTAVENGVNLIVAVGIEF